LALAGEPAELVADPEPEQAVNPPRRAIATTVRTVVERDVDE